jgi:hypothetical protein
MQIVSHHLTKRLRTNEFEINKSAPSDIYKTIVNDSVQTKKQTVQLEVGDENEEIMRTVTRDGSVIRYLKDGN